jgi:predicted dienelactone hydrolase
MSYTRRDAGIFGAAGLATLLAFTSAPPADAAALQAFSAAGLRITAWLPAPSETPAPVIVFSHGFRGCGVQSLALTLALADAGYAVFAPDHADSMCLNLLQGTMAAGETPFRNPQAWNDQTYAARGADLRKLMDTLSIDPRFVHYDWNNVGLAGHSLGGYTALGLAGGWESWKDPRVKAVLAMSAYSPPYILQNTLGAIDVPVMYQGGTNDMIEPRINNAAYDQMRGPKYYVELQGANHYAWTVLQNRHYPSINGYATAFFDRYLKGLPADAALREKRPDVSVLRFDSGE